MNTQARCYNCQEPLDYKGKGVGRKDTCPKCDADIKVCLNCQFYDPQSYNDCREPSAERVVTKDKSNFCDYFLLSGSGAKRTDTKDDALKKLNDLFK